MVKKDKVFGFCLTCINRVGSRLFRELPNHTNCANCIKVFKLDPKPPKVDTEPTVPQKTLGRAKVPKPVKDSSEARQLRAEEELLAEWWRTHECGHNWRQPASRDLGIPVSRLMFIARRLQRRQQARIKTLDTLLLEKLTTEPIDAYALAKKLPNFKFETVYQRLGKLVDQGVVLRIKNHPYKNLYFLPDRTNK